jgi:hypothetical protein
VVARRVVVGAAIGTLLGALGAATPAAAATHAIARPLFASHPSVRRLGLPARSGLSGTRFDVAAPSSMFLREKRIRDATVMQSFAFDDANGRLYVAQVMQRDRQLGGESAPVSGTQRSAHGDVCISRLDYAGRLLSWMYLRGFGHPVGIGVEPVGSSAYLWLGTASVPRKADGVGYPTRVGRVRFVPGGVVTYPSTAIQVHQPIQGATEVSVSVDAMNRTLLLRCLAGGAYRYNLYGLDAFKSRTYKPLYSRTETGISDVFQGHAHLADRVYRLEGRAGGVTTAPTHVSCFDLPSGRTVQRAITEAARTLRFREPEGLAVQLKPLRLHMGFADGVRGARNISLYYKDRYSAS